MTVKTHIYLSYKLLLRSDGQAMTKVIEHIVLFKVKEDAPAERVQDWLARLNSLSSLDSVLCLCAAPCADTKGCNYTHILHARFASLQALADYNVHPTHVDVVQNYGAPIVEDVLSVDWEADVPQPSCGPCKGLRVSLIKPVNAESSADLDELFKGADNALKGVYDAMSVRNMQSSFGKNVTAGRDKGFVWGFLQQFADVEELRKFSGNEEEDGDLLTEEFVGNVEKIVVTSVCEVTN